MVQNGRWFAPRDLTGEVITKPPAFAWLVALGMIGTKGVESVRPVLANCSGDGVDVIDSS
jgi:hypothetical protein